MRHLFTLLCGLLITAPIIGATVVANTITLEDEEIAECRKGGGCFLVTRQKLQALEALDCRDKS